MRILLIAPSYSSEPYFPLGLAYLAAYIRQQSHEVFGINLQAWEHSEHLKYLQKIITTSQPELIGIGGLTVAYKEIKRLIDLIRPLTAVPIVLGGGITACESELVMSSLRPDFMVVGEGEIIFSDLLQSLAADQRDYQTVKGIWYWEDDTPRFTGDGQSVNDLDTLPSPELDLFDIRFYLEQQSGPQISYHLSRMANERSLPILASRSCPFRCTFCYHAGMGKYKRHAISQVVDHIEHCIERYGVSSFTIYDELFSSNKKRIHEFCDLLAERNISISWFCQLRVDQLDQPLLDRMKASGCDHISFGFESGCDAILGSMDKKINTAQIAAAVVMTRAAKIGIQANFLFGDPGETEETLKESLRFQEQNKLHFTDWSAVIPYPGTRIYDHAIKKGLIKDRLAFLQSQCNITNYLWNHMINLTELSDARFRELYVGLRELNDQNHRKRLAIVDHREEGKQGYSDILLRCPSCNHQEQYYLPYPPEVARGLLHSRSPIGVPGINFLCEGCLRKMHLPAKEIPHIGKLYHQFQKAIDQLSDARTEVVLIPAMDRYFGVFAADIDLGNLNIIAVLDRRPHRFGESFLNRTTQPLTQEILKNFKEATFVILPWIEYEEALLELHAAKISEDNILCWNRLFITQLEAPRTPTHEPFYSLL